MAKSQNNGKTSLSNSFEGGLNADLHKFTSPSDTVFDALNMQIITTGDSQYIYQDIQGDKHVIDFPKTTKKHNGVNLQYVPLGFEINYNIAYILLGAFDPVDNTCVYGAIGTFPSPNWGDLNAPGNGKSPLLPVYSHLHNFRDDNSTEATGPFESASFNFEKHRHMDIKIQGDYDGSVNVIYTDDLNKTGIINSRFARIEKSNIVKLADRYGDADSNIYSNKDWDRIALIQNANYPITVSPPIIEEGGYLKGGGYRYYFKYTTQEGNTTEILYESPLIPIANGYVGLNKDQISNKLVKFELSNLDSSYVGIVVLFAHFDGTTNAIMEIYEIDYTYYYKTNLTEFVITHTGLETVTPVDVSEINSSFTPIDTLGSITVISDRLAMARGESTISSEDILIMQDAAKTITLQEERMEISKSYADPATAANYLGYWKGEAYEFGIVFLLRGKGISPVFPTAGMDNFNNSIDAYPNNTIDSELKDYPQAAYDSIVSETGFSPTDLVNYKGLFRTSNTDDNDNSWIFKRNFSYPDNLQDRRNVVYFKANLTEIVNNNPDIQRIAVGAFMVRRRRVKNVLMQGMAVPTLKLPAKYPTVPENVFSYQFNLDCAKRYCIIHYDNIDPTLGLNAPYAAITDNKGGGEHRKMFNDDFSTVFVPQPTQVINTITYEKSWLVPGSIGQTINSTRYADSIDKDGNNTHKRHLAFYSAELDLNYANVADYLNGINPQMEVQALRNGHSPIGFSRSKKLGKEFYSNANLVISTYETVDMNRSEWITVESGKVKATLMPSGQQVFAKGAFTAKTDRAFGFASKNVTEQVEEEDLQTKTYSAAYYPFVETHRKEYNVLRSESKVHTLTTIAGDTGIALNPEERDSDDIFYPYSLITQSYSTFLGVEINTTATAAYPEFDYNRAIYALTGQIGYELDTSWPPASPSNTDNDLFYLNVGHLANVFRSSAGRWKATDIENIFKYDSNESYYAVTDRFTLDKNSIEMFRGDGFISSIHKRVTYKNGVPVSQSATSADAATFGVGIVAKHGRKYGEEAEKLTDLEKVDSGRGLFDVGQVMEIVSYSNINADIRSVENVSDTETALVGYPRDFYPNRTELFGDARPDSTAYNHGYTGEENPLTYNRIEEYAPVYNTSFPNRIFLSEKNQSQTFFNSFRNLKGFNYRDYGVEFGPITKIIDVKNNLLSIHPGGVLAIGIDNKTLMSEGSDVFVDTAEALSPTAVTVSDVFGSIHPESVVKTDMTVAGVDYYRSAIWLFRGEKLDIISEFSVKTILEIFKTSIESASFPEAEEDAIYGPRIFSTYNINNHELIVSYVAQNSDTLRQFHIGSLVYNTLDGKWVTRLSEGNKFGLAIGSQFFTTGFSDFSVDSKGKKEYGIGVWQYGSLVDDSGDPIASRFRGIDYPHEFEITLNGMPTVEKMLDNIQIICNKSLPATIIYSTTGDENDAADNIWGPSVEPRIVTQPIITRNKSSRNQLRLGILDENAYYKNSSLYIEVGRMSKINRDSNKKIRDKCIRVRFIYTGNDKTFIQGIISMLSISYS